MTTLKQSLGKRFACLAVVMTGYGTALAHADATLVYEMTDVAGDKSQYTFTLVERFVRIDSEKEQNVHWLYDSGFRKLYKIDDGNRRYKMIRLFDNPHVKTTATAEQSAAGSKLIASNEKKSIAGISCRVITEKIDDKVVAQHCMAGTGPLGLSKRELYTLSRLLSAPGKLQFGWPGVATADERFAAVQSQMHAGKEGLELKSISHDSVPDEQVQIPKAYKNLDAPPEKVPAKKPDDASKS